MHTRPVHKLWCNYTMEYCAIKRMRKSSVNVHGMIKLKKKKQGTKEDTACYSLHRKKRGKDKHTQTRLHFLALPAEKA